MARVFAFATHRVQWQTKPPRGPLEPYIFPQGEARDTPDDLAEYVTGAHPQKLRILADGEPLPSLTGGVYADTSMGESPGNRMLCGQPTKGGASCQMKAPCRWHDR